MDWVEALCYAILYAYISLGAGYLLRLGLRRRNEK